MLNKIVTFSLHYSTNNPGKRKTNIHTAKMQFQDNLLMVMLMNSALSLTQSCTCRHSTAYNDRVWAAGLTRHSAPIRLPKSSQQQPMFCRSTYSGPLSLTVCSSTAAKSVFLCLSQCAFVPKIFHTHHLSSPSRANDILFPKPGHRTKHLQPNIAGLCTTVHFSCITHATTNTRSRGLNFVLCTIKARPPRASTVLRFTKRLWWRELWKDDQLRSFISP